MELVLSWANRSRCLPIFSPEEGNRFSLRNFSPRRILEDEKSTEKAVIQGDFLSI